MKLFTCEQMRELDSKTISLTGIPGIVLMENAALGVMNRIQVRFNSLKGIKAVVACGKGNNAGDGYAIARHLCNKGAKVDVLAAFDPLNLSGDARTNYIAAKNMGINITDDLKVINGKALIIDAIFGTGISGDITGSAKEAIECINNSGAYIIAVDIPSGIDGDSGNICGLAVKANETVVFGFLKTGLATYPAPSYTGSLSVCDISIPKYIENSVFCNTYLTDIDFVKSLIPAIYPDANKGNMGKVLVIAGSLGMTGAAALCCEAALRSGAGLVTLAIAKELNAIMEIKLTEAMTLPICEGSSLSIEAIEPIRAKAKWADAMVFGPGLGQSQDIYTILETLIKEIKIPLIIDADGINALCKNINILKEAKQIVLTPHPGEFARLTGLSIEQVQGNRLQLAREFASKWQVTLVLKGARTVIALPDGTAYINPTGNPGMATGGSGDVLCGIIAALAARTINIGNAAVAGVYMHGQAADNAANALSQLSLLPTDIINNLFTVTS